MAFFRFMNNVMAPMANDAKDDVDMSPAQADALLTYQLSLPEPRYLTPDSLVLAGIVDNATLGAKVFKVLVKQGLARPAPSPASAPPAAAGGSSSTTAAAAAPSQMTVDTTKITRKFANKFAVVSVHAQRKLIGLLFFWEEECVRWRVLDQEEVEIVAAEGAATEPHAREELALALMGVRRRKALLPSQRAANAPSAVAGGADGVGLPAYRAAA